jgi:hypothetical protein
MQGPRLTGLYALMQGLFDTGYNFSTYAFAWTLENIIYPAGKGDWMARDADCVVRASSY